MNSLLGNFNLPMGANAPSILMAAFGAAMRGENPAQFLQNLAQQHPQLRQYDFSNIQAAAQQVCQDHNVDPNQVANKVNEVLAPIVNQTH